MANNNGTLTFITTSMEYSSDNGNTWTDGTGLTLTGKVPGTYLIRVKAVAGTSFRSNSQTVVINAFNGPTVDSIAVTGPLDGYYKAGQEIEIAVTLSKAVTGTKVPELAIKFGSGEEIVLDNGKLDSDTYTTINYTYKITGGDNGTLSIIAIRR